MVNGGVICGKEATLSNIVACVMLTPHQVNKICTFLLSGQLVASMFNLLAGNFQHVQLATALAQLRTGADQIDNFNVNEIK